MGNRACVVFTDGRRMSPAIYLHWNGGPESVYPFLEALNRYGALGEVTYSAARFTQLVGNFFGGTLSLGVIPLSGDWTDCDPGDNGVYLVRPGREHFSMRRYLDGVELSREQVEREREGAMRHRYQTEQPSLSDKIDEANAPVFCGPHGACDVAVARPAGSCK